MYIFGNFFIGIATVLDSLLFLYMIIVIAAVIISWVNADPSNMIVRAIYSLTEPLFAKIRNRLPNLGPFDFTPLIVLFIIMFLRAGVVPSIRQIGIDLL